jgi:glycosyltransferase involved in cell wall biosynthesis
MGTKKRVAIFAYCAHVSISPSIINSAMMLSRAGYSVDLVTLQDEHFPVYQFADSNICTFAYPWREPEGFLQVQKARIDFVRWSIHACRGKRYVCFIGVDPEGLLTATLLGAIVKTPVFYYSLELFVPSELRPGWTIRDRLMKSIERFCNQRAVRTIVQNESRAAVLVKNNGIDPLSVLIVPDSPLGLPHISRRDWWHQKFALSSDCKVILQAGGIGYSRLSYELAQAAQEWPDDWVLVLHGWELQPGYIDCIRPLTNSGRVLLSLEPVPYEQLDDLYGSASIGIALYRNVDQNYYHIASGKIPHYLRCGIPVIATDFPNLRRILHDHQCGICVAAPAQIKEAIEAIFRNYGQFSENAQRTYLERLEFGRYFEKVIDEIAALG